jgi:hypothetical protein
MTGKIHNLQSPVASKKIGSGNVKINKDEGVYSEV